MRRSFPAGVGPPALPGLVIREGTPRSHLQTRSTTSGHTSLAATGQLTEQFVKLTDRQAVQIGHQIGAELRRAVELVGWIGSAGIGNHPPLQGSMGSVGAAGAVGLAALGSADPLLDQPLGAFRAASDHRHPPLRGPAGSRH
jgi:hypothetical protein